MNRVVIVLTQPEQRRFRKLRPISGEAQNFWWKVARDRGLDPGSVLTVDGVTSGLPKEHTKHWCWPYAARYKSKPEDMEYI